MFDLRAVEEISRRKNNISEKGLTFQLELIITCCEETWTVDHVYSTHFFFSELDRHGHYEKNPANKPVGFTNTGR